MTVLVLNTIFGTDANNDGVAQASEQPLTSDVDMFLIKDQDMAIQLNFANWFTYYRKTKLCG